MEELSPGVQILIDQMKSNPDEFFGPLEISPRVTRQGDSPKFRHIAHQIAAEVVGLTDPRKEMPRANDPGSLWFLTDFERSALKEAFTEAKRLRFDAEIITILHHKPDPEDERYRTAYIQGGTATLTSAASNVATSALGLGGAVGIWNGNR